MLTLAGDFGDRGVIVGLVIGSLSFLVLLAAALGVARWRPGLWSIAAVVWALTYPVAQIVVVFQTGDGVAHGALSLGIPSAVSALVLGRCTRSWIPVGGCASGVVATLVMWDVVVPSAAIAVPWNVCVGTSLMVWAVRARTRLPHGKVCGKCGYDLRGLPTAVCPECGPGRCSACGYDLRGLSGGVCPECGKAARTSGEITL
ncbi:MAG TPA: hypothetical protein VFF65_06475 [Phycisphaerales bacterium]|nr:hypothetical protein [Phycisphaerales bacterium]